MELNEVVLGQYLMLMVRLAFVVGIGSMLMTFCGGVMTLGTLWDQRARRVK